MMSESQPLTPHVLGSVTPRRTKLMSVVAMTAAKFVKDEHTFWGKKLKELKIEME